MPQVASDPAFNPGIISNGGTDLFAYPSVAQPSLLGLQTQATLPLPPGTASATNLLNPGQQVAAQLSNFPGDVYDVSPTSLLYHFMAALLGDAGAGQLRKRQMIARLQQAITSTQFYDLDSFYGALFGAQRGPSGAIPQNPATSLPVSPYTDLASPDGWDEVLAADARFRERIIQLAKAITLGATVPGIQALAEAVTGTSCQVWEAWRVTGGGTIPAPVFQQWNQVQSSWPLWSSVPPSQTWAAMEGYVAFSGLGINGIPSEIVIEPRKTYPSGPAGLAEQGADAFGILSVAETLRPATAMISVSPQGLPALVAVPLAGAWSDSQNQEIIHIVTPSAPASPAYAATAASYQGTNAAETAAGSYVQPSPLMSRVSTGQYSCAGDVSSVTARAVSGSSPAQGTVTDGQDFQTVISPGGPVRYLPGLAVMPASRAQTGRTASPVAVRSAPYSGPRVPVTRST